MKEFIELKLGSMTIDEYERRFLEVLKYVSFIKDAHIKIHRYLRGIPSFINDKIQYDDPKTLEETIRRDKCLYDKHGGGSNLQKAWEEKKKSTMEQKRKGTKPPFFRNNSQGKPMPKEPKMIETMVERPRQRTIQCWGCGRDHMYRDFPHRGEKLWTVHNV
jgi:hypothetical protein